MVWFQGMFWMIHNGGESWFIHVVLIVTIDHMIWYIIYCMITFVTIANDGKKKKKHYQSPFNTINFQFIHHYTITNNGCLMVIIVDAWMNIMVNPLVSSKSERKSLTERTNFMEPLVRWENITTDGVFPQLLAVGSHYICLCSSLFIHVFQQKYLVKLWETTIAVLEGKNRKMFALMLPGLRDKKSPFYRGKTRGLIIPLPPKKTRHERPPF